MAFVKLPNFLSVETKPFDLATYEDEFEEDEVMDDEGRSRLKLRVQQLNAYLLITFFQYTYLYYIQVAETILCKFVCMYSNLYSAWLLASH